jgi:hypothetical protein
MRLLEKNTNISGDQAKTIHEIFDSKEESLDQYLCIGGYRRASFLDHFMPDPMDFGSFRKCQYQEEGDFIKKVYEMGIRGKGLHQEVPFSHRGELYQNGEGHPVTLEKLFTPSQNRSVVKATYRISDQADTVIRTNFGIEFNINLLAGDAPDWHYNIPGHRLEDRKLASIGALKDVSEIQLVDEWVGMKVVLKTDRNCHLWRFPVETVSLSESGFERIFQGSCLLLYWPLDLEPAKEFRVTIELGTHSLKD